MNLWELARTNYHTVRQQQYEVAVLPFGATEPHNFHLPYGTDNLETTAIGRRACELAHQQGARVILLPTIPYGVDVNQHGFPLAMNLYPTTLYQIISDLTESLDKHGIPKLVILNGHGGNELKPALRELYERRKVFLCLLDWYKADPETMGELFPEPGDHGGDMETSLMLHLVPDLVDLSLADDGSTHDSKIDAFNEGWAQLARPWHLVTHNSGHGDPRSGTAEKGKVFFERLTEKIAGFLVQLSQTPRDDRFPY